MWSSTWFSTCEGLIQFLSKPGRLCWNVGISKYSRKFLLILIWEDISGLNLFKDIKSRWSETECIVLTGHALQSTTIDPVILGAFSYFQKPYQEDQLRPAIQRAAEKHIAGMANHERVYVFCLLIENSSDLVLDLKPGCYLELHQPIHGTSPGLYAGWCCGWNRSGGFYPSWGCAEIQGYITPSNWFTWPFASVDANKGSA